MSWQPAVGEGVLVRDRDEDFEGVIVAQSGSTFDVAYIESGNEHHLYLLARDLRPLNPEV